MFSFLLCNFQHIGTCHLKIRRKTPTPLAPLDALALTTYLQSFCFDFFARENSKKNRFCFPTRSFIYQGSVEKKQLRNCQISHQFRVLGSELYNRDPQLVKISHSKAKQKRFNVQIFIAKCDLGTPALSNRL